MEVKIKDIRCVMKHAEIQSVLDIKAFFGEFSFKVFEDLSSGSEKVYSLIDTTPYAMFFIVPTNAGYNLFSILTPKASSHEEDIKRLFSEEIKQNNIEVLVYKGNKKLYNTLTKVGFSFEKEMKAGVEKRLFSLLKRG